MDTQACHFCHKHFNVKIRCCPFCGGEHKKPALHKSPSCPRCRKTLAHFEYRKTILEHCLSCEGVWLDTQEFNQLTSEREIYTDDSIPYVYHRQPLPDDKGYLACPLCNTMMMRKNFRTISGVLIDQCRDHGIWLDAGELDQIRCFIANGGLDQSQDKKIMKNTEEIDFVAHKVKNIEYMQKRLHFWNFKYWLFKI